MATITKNSYNIAIPIYHITSPLFLNIAAHTPNIASNIKAAPTITLAIKEPHLSLSTSRYIPGTNNKKVMIPKKILIKSNLSIVTTTILIKPTKYG